MMARQIEMTPGDLLSDEAKRRRALFDSELTRRFGVSDGAVREAMKPLFLLMFRHGVSSFNIERDGTRAHVTFN